MNASVIWMMSTGVDPSHMNHAFVKCDSRAKAMDAMADADLQYPVRYAQVARIAFDHPLRPASSVEIVARRHVPRA